MDSVELTCIIFVMFLLSITFLASIVKMLFTSDELNEMGIHIKNVDA